MAPRSKESRLAETAAWLDLLYGKCQAADGQLVVVRPERNMVRAVHSVGSGADLVAAARDMQSCPGCYLKINLMDWQAVQRRNRFGLGGVDEVKTIVSFHLDVDAGKGGKYVTRSHALWALDNMPQPPTLLVNSNGDNGGFHAYWILKKPERISSSGQRKSLQAKANRWQARLKELCNGKLDSTGNIDRVLRCVGVPRLDGGEVAAEFYDPNRLYEIKDFQ